MESDHCHALSQLPTPLPLSDAVHQRRSLCYSVHLVVQQQRKPSTIGEVAVPQLIYSPTKVFPTNQPSPALARSHPLESGHWQVLGEGILIKPLSSLEDINFALLSQLPTTTNSSELNSSYNQQEAQQAHKLAEQLFGMDEGREVTLSGPTPTGNGGGLAGDESPGANSQYGDFYWDTNGEHASTDVDDLLYGLDSNLFNLGGGGGGSRARLGRTQEDLHKYKQRIDATVEHQREYSDIIAAMQNKLQEYRKHIIDLEKRIKGGLWFYGWRHDWRRRDTWNTSRGGRQRGDAVFGAGDANSNYEMVMRLDEERRRYDDIRNQLENERQNNDQLQHEMERLRREFENSLRDKERHFHNRERNLSQYLSDEQKKMLDLWTELQRVRKQFAELKDKTENDLNNQRNDFQRVIRSVQGVTRSLLPGEVPSVDYMGGGGGPNTNVYNKDSVLIEVIRRMKDTHAKGGPLTSDLDLLTQLRNGKSSDSDELESKGDENVRKVAELEAELRRTKERLNDCQNAIRKMYDLSSNNERNSDSQKRARSLSPGATPIQPSEAVRSLRTVLREKNSEIEQLERRLRASEKQIAEYRELGNFQKQFDDRERQVRRLEDKLKAEEYEKKAAETAQKGLETELQRLRQQFEKSTTEDSRKAREEADEFASNLEQDYKNRIDDLNRRIALLQEEKNKYKNEVSPIRNKYRDLENQYNALVRKLEEKEAQLKTLTSRTNACSMTTRHKSSRSTCCAPISTAPPRSLSSDQEQPSARANSQGVETAKDEYSKQRDELSRQLLNEELEKLKAQLTDYERQLILVRKHNDELDSQLKTGQAKTLALENEIVSNRKEIEKSAELNQRLQREKMEISSAKQDLEAEVQRLKDQIQKLEKDMENILTENKSLMSAEIKAKDALAHQVNRNHFLQKEWEEAQAKVKELQEKLDQLEKDYKSKSTDTGKSTDTSGTGTSTVTGGGADVVEGGEGAAGEQPSGYDSDIVEIRIKEVNDKWKLEVERLENEKDQLESRIRELEDQLLQAERINERHQNDVEDAKRKLQTEIERLKGEISLQADKHHTELDEERESYRKNLETIRLGEEGLADKLRVAEKRLADALNAQNEYERNKKETEERLNTVSAQNQKLKDDLEDVRTETEKEVQKWKSEAYGVRSELKSLESTLTGLKAQLSALTERNDTLNKTVNDYVSKIRDLNTQVRKLEEDLLEARSSITAKDVELDSSNNRLRTLEEEHLALQLDSAKNQTSLDNASRENQSLKSNNTSLEAELQKLQKKLQESDIVWKEQKNSFDHIKSEKDRLQNAFREKAKQAENLQKLAAQFEQKVSQLRKELQETSEKLIISENDRTNMRTEITRVQQELDFGKTKCITKMMNTKTPSRTCRELEAKRYEVTDLGSRLEKTEQRMNNLQQEFVRTSTERDVLQDVLRRFQNTVNRVTTMNRFKSSMDPDAKDGETGDQDGTPRADGGEPFRSAPFPAPLDFGSQGGKQLQRERDQFREELNRLKKKSSETHTTLTTEKLATRPSRRT
uniref:Rootletin-like coiled-coil domain-containing protein n=1 Tax=Ditylenchus dipsaci TaxID=166011 RepID=A0A915E022_9BILA